MTASPTQSQKDDCDWILVDARGHRCPVPTLRLRRQLTFIQPGQGVRLLADDPMAQIDVPHFCNQNNFLLVNTESRDQGWAFDVRLAP